MNAILQKTLKEAPGVEGLETFEKAIEREFNDVKLVTEEYIRDLFVAFYYDEFCKGLDKMSGMKDLLVSTT